VHPYRSGVRRATRERPQSTAWRRRVWQMRGTRVPAPSVRTHRSPPIGRTTGTASGLLLARDTRQSWRRRCHWYGGADLSCSLISLPPSHTPMSGPGVGTSSRGKLRVNRPTYVPCCKAFGRAPSTREPAAAEGPQPPFGVGTAPRALPGRQPEEHSVMDDQALGARGQRGECGRSLNAEH
jgi:hypothetical protein